MSQERELGPSVPHCGVFCGDFTAQGVVLLGLAPQTASAGPTLSALHFLTRETLAVDPDDFWVLEVGSAAMGQFNVLAQAFSLAGGLQANVLRMLAFSDPVRYDRGMVAALRLTPSGAPPPLVGLSVVPEWGILASRRP